MQHEKNFKEAAESLRMVAGLMRQAGQTTGPEFIEVEAGPMRAKLNVGDGSPEALEARAKKLEKQARYNAETDSFKEWRLVTAPQPLKSAYDGDVVKRFLGDDEQNNALTYKELFGKEAVFIRHKSGPVMLSTHFNIKGHDGFVVGRYYEPGDGSLSLWDVTHIDTGMACGSAAPSKDGALEKFKKIPPEKLAAAIKSNSGKSGYQSEARALVGAAGD